MMNRTLPPLPALARIATSAALAFCVVGLTAQPGSAQTNNWDRLKALFKSDEILVKMKTTSDAESAKVHARQGGKLKKKFRRINWEEVKIPLGLTVQQALARYKADPNVEYAEPNYVVHATSTPNDPSFKNQWDMTKISAPTAWSSTTGSNNVVVAVIDTGVDYNHSDLQANMWHNPGEIAGNGKDDDGNGYVDDVYGIDAADSDSDPLDDNNHGTHCAGTIGAVGNNGTGISGVNWNVKIMALKFLDSSGSGYDSDAITCLEYAIAMKKRGINIVATSNSWGGPGYSTAMKNAFDDAYAAGILNACAAGNEGLNNDTDSNRDYPSSFSSDGIISVAASDSSDNRPSWSNYGATNVDLAAPGVSILSTLRNNSYGSYSGTSMATPHVAGAIALLASGGSASPSQLRQLILNNVDVLPQWQGVVATGGRLNLAKALSAMNPPVNRQPDLTIRNASESSGSASGDDIYNTSGTSQNRNQDITNGATATYLLGLQNDGEESGSFVVTAPAGSNGWSVQYLDSNNTDITAQVTGSGWTTASLAPGAQIALQVRITASSPSTLSRSVLVTATSSQDSNQQDAVQATATIPGQPDLLIRSGSESDAQYAINNGYQSTPSGAQIEAQSVQAGTKASFRIQLQNDGNSARTFAIKTSESASNLSAWSLTYKDSSGKNMATALKSSGGYVTQSLSPGKTFTFLLDITPQSGRGLQTGDTINIDLKAFNDASDIASNTVRDVVRAQVSIAPTPAYGTDLSVRPFGTPTFSGAGVINTSGSGQTVTLSTPRGTMATFYVRITNTGNVADIFKVAGGKATTNWSLKYFEDETNTDITSAVTSGKWKTRQLAPTETQDVRLEVTPSTKVSIGSSLNVLVTATSNKNSTKKDAVKTTTTALDNSATGTNDPTNDPTTDPTPPSGDGSTSVEASKHNDEIWLDFGGAGINLDPQSADDPLHYTVTIKGKSVSIKKIRFEESGGIVVIKPSSKIKGTVVVEWNNLPTLTGEDVSGTAQFTK